MNDGEWIMDCVMGQPGSQVKLAGSRSQAPPLLQRKAWDGRTSAPSVSLRYKYPFEQLQYTELSLIVYILTV